MDQRHVPKPTILSGSQKYSNSQFPCSVETCLISAYDPFIFLGQPLKMFSLGGTKNCFRNELISLLGNDLLPSHTLCLRMTSSASPEAEIRRYAEAA